jgi:myxalamid-type polyketide synthase MxaE and MxaD
MNAIDIQNWLVRRLAETLQLAPSALDVREPFASYGISSAEAVALSGELEELLHRTLPATLVYEYPTIRTLAEYLGRPAGPTADAEQPRREGRDTQPGIAIIGIGCRFPGAPNPSTYWQLLKDGRDMIREVPPDRWDLRRFYHPDGSLPGKSISRWGGFLDDVDLFDPFFFGISPGEAERMDPQQRLLLELAYEAFEDAGYPLNRLKGTATGVFVGISVNEYGVLQYGQYDQLTGHSGTGNALSIAANRISYFFDLNGPSMAIDTACSSSLAAVHLACRSLRSGECGLAIAGGVNIILSPAHSIAFTKAGVLARDGRCKVFDALADGYVRGEGGGLVVLKPLAQALRDGDPIYAVIRGSAMGQDGRTNGLMAPSREAQEQLLRNAYRDAGLSPARVSYVEAHGTGTLLGDAMEARALGAVLAPGRAAPCKVGSVKSNFGHLEAAAGVAGLVKVALSLKERSIPASLHFESPNPHVPFSELGLEVQSTRTPWPKRIGTAIAGVSSFGFGGTNVHVVLEEAPAGDPSAGSPDPGLPLLLPLSARTPEALGALAQSVRNSLAQAAPDPSGSFQALIRSAAIRKNHLDHRVALLGQAPVEMIQRLDDFERGVGSTDLCTAQPLGGERRPLVFVFSGQGSQWPGMGRELLAHEPVFRAMIEQCEEALRPFVDWSLLDLLQGRSSAARQADIDVVQPALFAMQMGLAALWRSWGISPDAVVGHSMGEVAAAAIAGTLSLEDAARVISLRSKILRRLSGKGGMAVVGLSPEETTPYLGVNGSRLSIAAVNSPRTTVVAGERAALTEMVRRLENGGVFAALVNVDVASHSPQTAPLGDELRRSLEGLRPLPAQLCFVSTVTADPIDGQSLDPDYWARNITEPVRFADAISRLLGRGYRAFLEISPHPVLMSSVQQAMIHVREEGTVLASLQRDEGARCSLLRSLGALYVSGQAVDWKAVYPTSSPGRCVSLPPIPWQRGRYWLEGSSTGDSGSAFGQDRNGSSFHPLLGNRIDWAKAATEHLWESRISRANPAFLGDHRVMAETMVPGTAFIETALSAAREAGLAQSHELSDLAFLQPLTLTGERTSRVQVTLSSRENGVRLLEIWSKAPDDGPTEWTLHVTAFLRLRGSLSAAGEGGPTCLDELRARLSHQIRAEEFYETLSKNGLHYGPNFRGVEYLWTGDKEALGRIGLPGLLQDEAARYQIHPALLDSALQVTAAALLPLSDAGERGVLYLPAGCAGIQLHDSPSKVHWSHVVLRSGVAPRELIADLRLLDSEGRCVAELQGLRFARAKDRSLSAEAASKESWHYRIGWQESPWPDSAPVKGTGFRDRRRWIILSDKWGLGETLQKELECQGQSCRLFPLPDDWEKIPGGRVGRAQALGRLLEEVFDSERAPLGGVLHLWGADPGIAEPAFGSSLTLAQTPGCDSVLALVQILASRSGTLGMPRVWLVTRGAQVVSGEESPSLGQVPILGLAKSIALELPELQCSAADLDPSFDPPAAARVLIRQLSLGDSEAELAFRGGKRLVPRLLPLESPRICAGSSGSVPIALRSDSTYLITGGLGALGLAIAAWMVRRGARHLVLLGRREATPHAMETVDAMRQSGARIQTVAADVSLDGELARVVERIGREMPPLRGVLHGAGILENVPLVNLDVLSLSRVMASKVEGAWNLHAATAPLDLDFFVLFSSAVSVLGSPGQANYAAANRFLDALARHRRRRGLPALSINWGPWADIGLAQEGRFVDGEGTSGTLGVKGIRPEHGLELLGQAIGSDLSQLVALPFDLKTLLDLFPAAARLPFFSEVGGRESHVSKLYARPSLRQTYVAPRSAIELKLAELWRHTLRIDRVGVHDSFFELGGDSVLGAQIVTRARQAFGVDLDLKDAFRAFTIEALAERVESALLDRVESLSDAEAERLLEG